VYSPCAGDQKQQAIKSATNVPKGEQDELIMLQYHMYHNECL